MANRFDLRVDPTLLVPGARSVITVLINYYADPFDPKVVHNVLHSFSGGFPRENLPDLTKLTAGYPFQCLAIGH